MQKLTDKSYSGSNRIGWSTNCHSCIGTLESIDRIPFLTPFSYVLGNETLGIWMHLRAIGESMPP